MIYDARTNPRGFKLSIQQWPRDSRIMAIARAQGYRIPAPTFVAPDATPARALLNHGVWRAWCPDCAFSAEDVWRGHALFWCMRCGNLKAGNAWRPLVWPENWQQIEADLDPFPPQAQNWEPWGAAVDHVSQAEEWVEHAGLMIDPEHGLTDNEVGGADDPETYTTPVLAVTNAIIASSDANVDKGDIRYFRQFMPANPAGSNEWLQSVDANSAAWVARATAVLAALGYTPVNKAGDTMSGQLVFGGTVGVTFRGNSGATPSGAKDYAAQGLVVNAHNDSFEVYDQGLTTTAMFQALRSGGVSIGRIGGQTIYHTGNAGAFVPSGLVAMVRTAAEIPSGWSRETLLDGRLPVGAGTTFSNTFVEATNYGAYWDLAQTVTGTGTGTTGTGTTGTGTTGTGTAPGTISSGAASNPDNTSSASIATGGGTATTIKADATLQTLTGVTSSSVPGLSVPGLSVPSLSVTVSSLTASTVVASIVPPSRGYVYCRKS